MLPTVEQVDTAGRGFPRARVATHGARISASPVSVDDAWPAADLVIELPAVTRPTTSPSRRTRREVMAAAGGSRTGRGSP